MAQSKIKVIIIGANFAGINCAKYLTPSKFAVTVIDPQADFEWLPHIHELVSRQKRSEQLRHNRQQLIQRIGHNFIQDFVININKSLQTVTLANGHCLNYDHLVIAIGSQSSIGSVQGASEYAYAFNNIQDAEDIALKIQRLDSLSLPSRPIVLIGAGIEGLEILGEMIRRYQRRWRFTVHIIDQSPVLLPKYLGLDAFIKKQCQHLDIQWHLACQVQEITKDKVLLTNGKILDSRLTLWCGGSKPHSLLSESGLTPVGRHGQTTRYLQSTADSHIWLAGDCVDFPYPISKQAYHALPMGKLIAENIERVVEYKKPKIFRPLAIPSLMSFGDMGFLLGDTHALATPSLIAAKEGVFQANFNLIQLPNSKHEWIMAKNSLQASLLNMAQLAKDAWLSQSLFNTRIFKATD